MNKLFAVSTLATSIALAGCLDSDSSSRHTADDHAAATPHSVSLDLLSRYSSGVYGLSAAEITTHDPVNQRVFVVNARIGAIDVLDASRADDLIYLDTLSMDEVPGLPVGSVVNSITWHDGLLAAAVEAPTKTDNGYAALFDSTTLELINFVEVGAQPDNLTFTPDGRHLLTANEGEPSVEYDLDGTGEPESVREVYRVDPVGSVSVIPVVDGRLGEALTAGFERFNARKAELMAAGVRIFGPADNRQPYGADNIADVAGDLEPEYLAVSADSRFAWVSLQENNALARIDIDNATVTDIFPLGFKDHGMERNAMDVSDGDRKQCDPGNADHVGTDAKCARIDIRTWPGVAGMYHPDSIAAYEAGGRTYIVTANEGDARAWGEEFGGPFGDEETNDAYFSGDQTHRHTGFIEEWRVKHLTHPDGFDRRAGDDLPRHLRDLAAGAILNPDVFGYCGARLGDAATGTPADAGDCRDDFIGMGRLLVSWVDGYQKHADGTPVYYNRYGEQDDNGDRLMYDRLYAFGGRSFAIWDGETGEQVFDSGAHMERYMANQQDQADAIVGNLNDIRCLLGSDRSIPCDAFFNSNHSHADSMDRRSVNKGPEPEGIVLGQLGEKTYAFIGIERMGGVMTYDISNPEAPVFVDYLNTRENWTLKPENNLEAVGDLGAEGLHFIPADQSPSGEALLAVGHEVSGTTTLYRIDQSFED